MWNTLDTYWYAAGKMLGVFFDPPCILYLLLLYLLGALALPLCHRLLHRTRVAWFMASRALALSLLTYAAWVLGHNAFGWSPARVPGDGGGAARLVKCLVGNGLGVLPYSPIALWALVLVGAPFSLWGYLRYGRAMCRRLRTRLRAVVLGELIFLAAFSFCCVLRMHSHGMRDQEKYMDFAFLNACIYTKELPPPDPWRYDLPINYYYGGYLLSATMAKMTGVAPEIAYNLSVSVVFALTCLLSFALGYELTRRSRWAVLAVLAVAFMGNLHVAVQNWETWRSQDPRKRYAVEVWPPSRVIKDGFPGEKQFETINEFPFFSFLHADLHPHMVAVPWALLFVVFLFNLVARGWGVDPRGRGEPGAFGRGGRRWTRAAFTAWVLGFLAMTNGFDFLAFLFVFAVALFVREWLASRGWRGRAARERRSADSGPDEARPGDLLFLNSLTLLLPGLVAVAVLLYRLRAMLARAYSPEPPPAGWFVRFAPAVFAAAVFLAALLLVRRWRRAGRPAFHMLRVVRKAAAVSVVAVVLFAPFFVNYQAPIRGKAFAKPAAGTGLIAGLGRHVLDDLAFGFCDFHTSSGEFLTVWGTQFLALGAFLLVSVLRATRRVPSESRVLFWSGAGILWLLFFISLGQVVSATLLWLLAIALTGFLVSRKSAERTFVFVLAAASLIVLFGCERVYVRDSYGVGLQRMNTLFKFYYPCWLVLGICFPFFLRETLRAAALAPWLRIALGGGVLALMLWALEYPVIVSRDRIGQYRGEGGAAVSLDGMRYMRLLHPGDYKAILWLRENAAPNAVVLEAVGGAYSYYARVATHTPLRAVLGWGNHQSIWRGVYPGEIEADVKRIYSSKEIEPVRALLDRYNVEYIYVGELERQDYPAEALAKFDRAFSPPVYSDERNGVTIYRIARPGAISP